MIQYKTVQKNLDSLCKELTPQEEKELQETIQFDSEVNSLSQKLAGIWDLIGRAFCEDESDPEILQRVYNNIVSENAEGLTDEDLDKAAGGSYMYHYPNDYCDGPKNEE